MKTTTTTITLLAAFFFSSLNAKAIEIPSLTAEELAFHLGWKSWTSVLRLQDGNEYQAEICFVKDGIDGKALMAIPVYPTDRKFTKIAIIASKSDKKTYLTIQTAASPSMSAFISPEIDLSEMTILPIPLAEGRHILAGYVASEARQEGKIPSASTLKNGLILKITKK